MRVVFAFLLAAFCLSVEGFSPLVRLSTSPSSCSTTELLAGFGGSASKNGGKKQAKLKPKQQWDRFIDSLKGTAKMPVGVRMKEDDSDEWIRVGAVRSKDDAFTAISVAMQRALIADHAKRLFPLQVSAKKTMEWAYLDGEEWKLVDKSILETESIPDGIEKMIGFEGTPDPATGFYCIYDGGKLKIGEESSFK